MYKPILLFSLCLVVYTNDVPKVWAGNGVQSISIPQTAPMSLMRDIDKGEVVESIIKKIPGAVDVFFTKGDLVHIPLFSTQGRIDDVYKKGYARVILDNGFIELFSINQIFKDRLEIENEADLYSDQTGIEDRCKAIFEDERIESEEEEYRSYTTKNHQKRLSSAVDRGDYAISLSQELRKQRRWSSEARSLIRRTLVSMGGDRTAFSLYQQDTLQPGPGEYGVNDKVFVAIEVKSRGGDSASIYKAGIITALSPWAADVDLGEGWIETIPLKYVHGKVGKGWYKKKGIALPSSKKPVYDVSSMHPTRCVIRNLYGYYIEIRDEVTIVDMLQESLSAVLHPLDRLIQIGGAMREGHTDRITSYRFVRVENLSNNKMLAKINHNDRLRGRFG